MCTNRREAEFELRRWISAILTFPLLRIIESDCFDSFQGEESDIVIVSLVRSNPKGKLGFLESPNRTNVMLSRAKQGLYIVGNSEHFAKKSHLWERIVGEFKTKSCLSKRKLGDSF